MSHLTSVASSNNTSCLHCIRALRVLCRVSVVIIPGFVILKPLFSSVLDGRVNKSATRLVIGPKYTELRDWHHDVSARTLNVQ